LIYWQIKSITNYKVDLLAINSNNMQKFINWLLYSSIDPDQWSLTVKSFGFTLIPIALAISNSVFQLGLEQSQLADAVTSLATLVGVVLTGFGLVRKIYFTFKK
jgi:hypothetical protein